MSGFVGKNNAKISNRPSGGGDKLQGLASTTDKRASSIRAIQNRGGGQNRNLIFNINQLGGVGNRLNSQFGSNSGGMNSTPGDALPVAEFTPSILQLTLETPVDWKLDISHNPWQPYGSLPTDPSAGYVVPLLPPILLPISNKAPHYNNPGDPPSYGFYFSMVLTLAQQQSILHNLDITNIVGQEFVVAFTSFGDIVSFDLSDGSIDNTLEGYQLPIQLGRSYLVDFSSNYWKTPLLNATQGAIFTGENYYLYPPPSPSTNCTYELNDPLPEIPPIPDCAQPPPLNKNWYLGGTIIISLPQ